MIHYEFFFFVGLSCIVIQVIDEQSRGSNTLKDTVEMYGGIHQKVKMFEFLLGMNMNDF